MISPVVSSTFTPSGALSPGVNFVPSGALVSLPSLSVNFGAGTVAFSPGLPLPSSYFGSNTSVVGAIFSGTTSVCSVSLPSRSTSTYFTVTFGFSSEASTADVGVPVIVPSLNSKPAGRPSTVMESFLTSKPCGRGPKPSGFTSWVYFVPAVPAASGESVTTILVTTFSWRGSVTVFFSVFSTRFSGSCSSGFS